MRCPGFLIAMHKDCHGSILLRLMGNLKKSHDARMAEKRTNHQFLPKFMTYLQHL